MPATVELSVPPLRKQAGLLPSSCLATASLHQLPELVAQRAERWASTFQ